jgi:RNA polymerase sigma-70 factor (ECF subfamily)
MLTMAGDRFPATRWTLVLAAGRPEGADGQAALASLCEAYWYPIYAFLRRRGYEPDAARDLEQEFVLRLLGGHYVGSADPEKGRFRSFLLSSLKLFLSDERDRAQAQKRGGGAATLPFEISSGEELYQREPAHEETPERIYERRWARAVLDQVLNRLREEFVRHGRLEHFNRLKGYILGQSELPYAELARQLDTSESALKVGIHRLRKRYRDVLRAEIAATVAGDSDVDSELRYLIAVLSGK